MNPVSKPWYQSKTIWLAILSGVSSIVIAFAADYPTIAVFGTISTILAIAVRTVTSLPLSN